MWAQPTNQTSQFFPGQNEVRVQALQGRGDSDSEHGLWETLGQNPPTQKIRPLSVLSNFIKKAKQDEQNGKSPKY